MNRNTLIKILLGLLGVMVAVVMVISIFYPGLWTLNWSDLK